MKEREHDPSGGRWRGDWKYGRICLTGKPTDLERRLRQRGEEKLRIAKAGGAMTGFRNIWRSS